MKRLAALLLCCAAVAGAQLPRYEVTLSPAVIESLKTRDIFSNNYLPAVFRAGDSVYRDAQIRYKGKSNRQFPKRPIRIRFAKHHHFEGRENLNLHSMYTDRSCLREALSWKLFEEMGELAPRAKHVTLSINGIPQGIYLAVDNVDHAFLKRRGLPASSLYSGGGYYSLADMTVQSKKLLAFYYPKEAGDKEDYDDLYDLFTAVNESPDSLFERRMEELFDMNSVYNWFAGNILMMMGDSYNKNYFLYRNEERTTRQWTVIPWDYDISFGITGDPAVPYPNSLLNNGIGYSFPPLSGPANVLKDRIVRTPSMAARLRLRVDTLLGSIFTNEHLDGFIDSLAAVIRPAVAADTQKRGTLDDFDDAVEGLKHFITARRNYLRAAYIRHVPGPLNQTMLRTPAAGARFDCVGGDGLQFAQIELRSATGLDSLLIDVHADSVLGALDTARLATFVRRFVKIIPYPAHATFALRARFWYHDLTSKDREVSVADRHERELRCAVSKNGALRPLTSRTNPVSNVVMVDTITHADCGPDSWLVFVVPPH